MEPTVVPVVGWDAEQPPFHRGELAVQARAGVRSKAEAAGRRGIRRYMPEQHRQFFAEQPFMVLGGVDASGQPWATLRVGRPGFIASPSPRSLHIAAGSLPGDPLAGALQPGAMVGMLGIQPHTRRRNRVNGVVTSADEGGFAIEVSQSFGNCAKYIQGRVPSWVEAPLAASSTRVGITLQQADIGLLRAADTFFIATVGADEDAGPAAGADVSHRGGEPGFVRVEDTRTLTAPDFSGNNFFNTLGNLQRDPRAGLLFIDFASGDMLYLAVRAEVLWDSPEMAEFPGAERLVRFHIEEVRRSDAALPFRWSEVDMAPQFALARAAQAKRAEGGWQTLKVIEVRDEADGIRSFLFAAADGLPLARYQPGQHLTLRLPIPGQGKPVVRNYTVSDASNARTYRITVKRDGVVSHWLHDHVREGMTLEAMPPRGSFVLDTASGRPIVLLSAGIGITPMIAMLNSILNEHVVGRAMRPVYFIHGARHSTDRAFTAYLREAARRYSTLNVHLVNSAGGADGEAEGRVDLALLKWLLPFDDYDFYLCGPGPFMRDLYEGLRGMMIPDERIRFESFGPSSVTRIASSGDGAQGKGVAQIVFSRSQRTLGWSPADGSLLELAEAHGIAMQSDCRAGSCGTCAARLVSGKVRYLQPIEAELESGQVLPCSCVPDITENSTAEPVVLDL